MLKDEDLPKRLKDTDFTVPKAYARVVALDLLNLEPWYFLRKDEFLQLTEGLASRYPSRVLVPFARRVDCDDIACFVADDSGNSQAPVLIIHDFASPGYEVDASFQRFWDWFREAVNEMIAWSESEG